MRLREGKDYDSCSVVYHSSFCLNIQVKKLHQSRDQFYRFLDHLSCLLGRQVRLFLRAKGLHAEGSHFQVYSPSSLIILPQEILFIQWD